MILLHSSPESEGLKQVFAIFGTGLIGTAVLDRLRSVVPLEAETLPLDWHDSTVQQQQLSGIQACVENHLASHHPALLRVLWSAGHAGFAAAEEEVERELDSFLRVLQMVENLTRHRPELRGSWLQLSSAGGLFEGQRYVDPQSLPAPQRPYGWLKLRQEQRLLASGISLQKIIVRLTSVYGPPRAGQRRGLIPTLIDNGLRQRVTQFYGKMTTLRDFLWIDDVAPFLVDLLLRQDNLPDVPPFILASGKPSSILEIQKWVERTIGHKLYVAFSPVATNSQDITFSPAVLPAGWRASDLAVAIRKVSLAALNRGRIFPA